MCSANPFCEEINIIVSFGLPRAFERNLFPFTDLSVNFADPCGVRFYNFLFIVLFYPLLKQASEFLSGLSQV